MDKKLHPDSSIMQAIHSEASSATPFSHIPGFIKKFTIRESNHDRIMTILSAIADKEISHLNTRVDKIQDNDSALGPDLYEKVCAIESGTDA